MSAISQLSCSYSIRGRLHLNTRSYPCPNLRPKALIVMSHDGHDTELSNSEKKPNLSYTEDVIKSNYKRSSKLCSSTEENVNGRGITELAEHVSEQKRAAKIHDFCFGIPFGALILSGGLVGFAFSRNLATLRTSVLFGGALLALSTFSLKIWRQGKSSFPFILGQAVLSAALFWKNFRTYSLTKKLFPTGFYAVISAAMLCFYTYVVMSGGNPLPKKSKLSTYLSS